VDKVDQTRSAVDGEEYQQVAWNACG
jgi:hypothetical protein